MKLLHFVKQNFTLAIGEIMGYYMRYIVTEEKEITLSKIEKGLQQIDANYSIDEDGELKWGNDVYGVLDITLPGSDLFDEELEELNDELEDAEGNRTQVAETLRQAKAIVALQVLHQGREPNETLEKLTVLWHWLFDNYAGLLQADAEGYYSRDKQVLRL